MGYRRRHSGPVPMDGTKKYPNGLSLIEVTTFVLAGA